MDEVKDMKILELTAQEELETIIKRRLRWLGRLQQMENGKRDKEVLYCNHRINKKHGRLRKNLPNISSQQTWKALITWKESFRLAFIWKDMEKPYCLTCIHARKGLSTKLT